jgi:hypothetical protein
MADECFYCGDTGYIPGQEGEMPGDKLPDQMCPHCEIGQAVIKGFNAARDIGIQACDTLEAAKNKRIKELEAENERAEKTARCPCSGKLEGTGYDKKTKDVIFDCNKCKAQLLITYELWQEILKA